MRMIKRTTIYNETTSIEHSTTCKRCYCAFKPLYELRISFIEFIRIECMMNFDHILKTIYQAINWCHFSQEYLLMYKSIDFKGFDSDD